MAEPTCIIHIGTHKTGTTSQQYFLMQHSEQLRRGGLYFPKTGWYGVVPGHHALAWELASSDCGPVFSELLAELSESGCRAAVLSAEDFSLFYAVPKALEGLARELRRIGYTPRILVYLRPQGPFAESMYVERVKHDGVRPIDDFVREVASTGRYVPNNSILPLEFRYTRMLAPFVDIFGFENVVVRTYQGLGDVTHVFTDFLRTITLMSGTFQDTSLNLPITNPMINESLSFIRLLGTLHTKLLPRQNVPATAAAFRELYAPDLPQEYMNERFALFQRTDHRAILASVAEDNRDVERLFGAHVPFICENDIPSAIDPVWAKALVERRIFDRCYQEWSKRRDEVPPPLE